jgi:three-Cys-motif partner protein
MIDNAFEFEEVGQWSEIKLDIVEQYGAAYAKILHANKPPIKEFYYIDGFSGAGVHISRQTGQQIEGSPARALRISPSFDRCYFIDLNPQRTKYLQELCKDRSDVSIHPGDCNEYLSKEVLPKIKFEFYNRALCLLDPYGLHLDWDVIFQSGQSKAVDMFLNFPVMDMNRNAIWRRRDLAPREGIERMNRFWGDDSCQKIAWVENPQQNFWGFPDLIKQDNDTIAEAFRERLRKVAGFAYVPEPLPMKNSNNAVVYYLFFASKKSVAKNIVEDIFRKYRT